MGKKQGILEHTSDENTSRLLFFDNVRYLMVLFVVLLHASLSYSKVLSWWYVIDSNSSQLFDILVMILGLFAMPILFFVAGYFTLPSLQKKGPAAFLKTKFKRFGPAWLLGVVILVPIMPYIRHYTQTVNDGQTPLSYWRFWTTSMKSLSWFRYGPINLMEEHFYPGYFWFISLLLCFFVLSCFLYEAKKKYLGASGPLIKTKAASGKSILAILLLFGSLTSVGYYTTGRLSSFQSWVIIANFLMFQPANLVLYACYFVLGIYAFSKNWFADGKCLGRLTVWGPICFLLSAAYLMILKNILANLPPSKQLMFTCATVHSFLCLSFLIVFVSFGLRYLNRPSVINQKLASNSYNIYLVHLPIVVAFQLLLVNWAAPGLVKFGIVSLASILLSCGISQYIIKKSALLTAIGLAALLALMCIFIQPGR